jgi:hypothetical protein
MGELPHLDEPAQPFAVVQPFLSFTGSGDTVVAAAKQTRKISCNYRIPKSDTSMRSVDKR